MQKPSIGSCYAQLPSTVVLLRQSFTRIYSLTQPADLQNCVQLKVNRFEAQLDCLVAPTFAVTLLVALGWPLEDGNRVAAQAHDWARSCSRAPCSRLEQDWQLLLVDSQARHAIWMQPVSPHALSRTCIYSILPFMQLWLTA